MAIFKSAKNIKITTRKNDNIIVEGKMEIIADKISITTTKGNLVLSSNKKVQIKGLDGGVKHGEYEAQENNERRISEAIWMDSKMDKQIRSARVNELLSVKIKTENYDVGEMVSLKVIDQDDHNKTIQLMGYVQDDGYAILQEIMYVDPIDFHKNSNIA